MHDVCLAFKSAGLPKEALLYVNQPFQGLDLFIACRFGGLEMQFHQRADEMTNEIQRRLFEKRVTDKNEFGNFCVPLHSLTDAAKKARSQFIEVTPDGRQSLFGEISYQIDSGATIIEDYTCKPHGVDEKKAKTSHLPTEKHFSTCWKDKNDWDFQSVPREWIDRLAESFQFASKDETRYVLYGTHACEDGLIATDGHRLVRYDLKIDKPDMIIPKVGWLGTRFAAFDDWQVGKNDDRVAFRSGPWTMVTGLIEGNFPSTRQLFPDPKTVHWFHIDHAEFTEALQGFPGETHRLVFNMDTSDVTIFHKKSRTLPIGIEEVEPVKWSEPSERRSDFNSQYLRDSLALKPDRIGIGQPAKPAKNTVHSPSDIVDPIWLKNGISETIIMPMRITN